MFAQQQQAQAQVAAQAAVQQGQGPPGSVPPPGDGSFNPPSRQNSVRSQVCQCTILV
jgi:hypothetical protein